MRTVLRLGLAAAALGTAVLAPSASALNECVGAREISPPNPVWGAGVCVNDEFPVTVYAYGGTVGGRVVCWDGRQNVEVWVNGTELLPYPAQTCTPVIS